MDMRAASLSEVFTHPVVMSVVGKNLPEWVQPYFNTAEKERLQLAIASLAEQPRGALVPVYWDVQQKRQCVYLVQVGEKLPLSPSQFIEVIESAAKRLCHHTHECLGVGLSQLPVSGRDMQWGIAQITRLWGEASYRFTRCKSQPVEAKPPSSLLIAQSEIQEAKDAIMRGQAIAEGVNFARELGDLPGNICNPSFLAIQAKQMASRFGMQCRILEEGQLRKLNMGALLAVGQGSIESPKLIAMEYDGGPKGAAPYVLVGKGITFDTGGISIKPSKDMDQMKYDMCGAASVLGAMHACAQLKLPINVVGVIATAENFPGPHATRPGDIVTTMSGQTVEILDTDAEGRLVLADALTYVERYNPKAVVDMATLTGLMALTFGEYVSGLFSSDEQLASDLMAAGEQAHDRLWRMPLWEEYQGLLDSNFADFANLGTREGGSITAACFLHRFAKNYPWAHIDIAGTAWKTGKQKGATGRVVPMLTQWLIQASKA